MSLLLAVIAVFGLIGVLALVYAVKDRSRVYDEKPVDRGLENILFATIVLLLIVTLTTGLNWDRIQRAIPALRDEDYQYRPSDRRGERRFSGEIAPINRVVMPQPADHASVS
jgi:hypothetical protein